ncbi:hypothetical protein BASA81_003331 [Batrachochytrium salamandrivorans]|nr:hypothetical protein BASA81_003331 [Batrachochytrium salamandrivorans]
MWQALFGIIGLQAGIMIMFMLREYHTSVPLEHCSVLTIPGKTPGETEFGYITSATWIPQTSTLYVTSIGTYLFDVERAKVLKRNKSLDVAFNQSFPLEGLRVVGEIVRFAKWGQIHSICESVPSANVDINIFGKVNTLKCQFEGNRKGDGGEIIQLYTSNQCWKLDISQPQGSIARYTNRAQIVGEQNTMAVCIAGVKNFTHHALEAVSRQVDGMKVSHVYFGLNSNSLTLRRQYESLLERFIRDGRVSIIPSPAPDSDLLFTQAKLPFLSECLMHCKLHRDLFMGVWDLDEVPRYRVPPTHGSLAQHLIATGADKNTCFLALRSETCTRPHPVKGYIQPILPANATLGQRFPLSGMMQCANYTKAISIVPRVELSGIHQPEHCDLYPSLNKNSLSRDPSYVRIPPNVHLLHFIQLFAARFPFCQSYPAGHEHNHCNL